MEYIYKYSTNGGVEKIELVEKEKYEKHMKGLLYDSLAYRYIRARDQMAEYEYLKGSSHKHDRAYYRQQANRDIMRFCQLLDEAVGEHD